MSIVVVGCSHSSAPLPFLEQVAVPAGDIPALLASLGEVREALVVSTCNRTEIYVVCGHATSGANVALRALADRAGTSTDEVRRHAYVHADADAVHHALRVASGLESMVLGEDQIVAQWKRALAHARMADSLGPVLDRLGASALGCGKRVRTFTGIGRHAVSLESLAVRAAGERLGRVWNGRRVLLIGAGESASLVARQLQAAGRPEITVMSRSFDKAEAFAETMATRSAPIDRIADQLLLSDAIFCCTAAPHPVLSHAHFAGWSSRESDRPLVCVDLGMPRDVEPEVATLPGVRVVSLQELSEMAARHREERQSHVPAALAIVEAETARFLEWKTARGSAAAVARIRAHASRLATIELDVAFTRLAHLSGDDRDAVRALTQRIVNKLLHAPTVAMKSHPEAENIALALEYAFGLRGADGALAAALPLEPDAPAASEPIQETA